MQEDDDRRRTHTAAIEGLAAQTIAETDRDRAERIDRRAREMMARLRREYRGRVRQG